MGVVTVPAPHYKDKPGPATAISRSPMLSVSLALHSDVRLTLQIEAPHHVKLIPLGSTNQVRALASPDNDLILSASRDSTAIQWQKTTKSGR